MKNFATYLHHHMSSLESSKVHGLACSLILAIGMADFLTGFEMSATFFYLLPVGLVSWYGRGHFCFIAVALCVGTGQLANELAGGPHSSLYVSLWNDCIQVLMFGTVAILLRHIRNLLREAERLAQHDFLTGLLNRRALLDRLRSEFYRASRNGQPLVIGFIDLDHFKSVNDSLGHSEGDRLLYSLSRELKKTLRCSDIVARIGGDEFVLVLPDTDGQSAESVGQKIVETMSLLSAANDWPVTASVGLIHILTPEPLDDLSQIFNAADELMYEVKNSGRNNYLVRNWG